VTQNATLSHPSERYIALTLRIGAYGSFAILLFAIALELLGQSRLAEISSRVGVLLLMATPTVRIVAAVVMYISAGNKKMTAVAVGVLAIVVISSVVGLNLHAG
jgi:uncharacterized membrane protein